ncbi:MAG TPA: hypothetical protein VHP83_10950 [Aggregatilineaceae bacterium]|nr:hypothetical protein [Aggregatilineaceae bacterium]
MEIIAILFVFLGMPLIGLIIKALASQETDYTAPEPIHASAPVPDSVRMRWLKQKRTIELEPVSVRLLPIRTQQTFNTLSSTTPGVIGAADNDLVFEGENWENYHFRLRSIRWIGIKTIYIQENQGYTPKEALAVYPEYDGEWHAFTFVVTEADQTVPNKLPNRIREFARVLAELSQLQLQTCAFEDWGPVQARRLKQDVYGHWQAADSGDQSLVVDIFDQLPSKREILYLAPDRLI